MIQNRQRLCRKCNLETKGSRFLVHLKTHPYYQRINQRKSGKAALGSACARVCINTCERKYVCVHVCAPTRQSVRKHRFWEEILITMGIFTNRARCHSPKGFLGTQWLMPPPGGDLKEISGRAHKSPSRSPMFGTVWGHARDLIFSSSFGSSLPLLLSLTLVNCSLFSQLLNAPLHCERIRHPCPLPGGLWDYTGHLHLPAWPTVRGGHVSRLGPWNTSGCEVTTSRPKL